jgi:uncharacterized protein
VSYVRLKHTLAEIALDVVEHPDRASLAAVLAAYGRMSGEGGVVSVAALSRAAAVSPEDVLRLLRETHLFGQAGTRAVALAPAFRPFAPYLRRQTARLEQARQALRSSPASDAPLAVWRGAVLFNAGLFFECHEYLEDVWRTAPPLERAFYHGLVQAAAGCYHLEKANRHGARTLLAKAIDKLGPYGPVHLGVDVAALLSGLRALLAAVEASPPFRPRSRAQLPIIMVGSRSGAPLPLPGGRE